MSSNFPIWGSVIILFFCAILTFWRPEYLGLVIASTSILNRVIVTNSASALQFGSILLAAGLAFQIFKKRRKIPGFIKNPLFLFLVWTYVWFAFNWYWNRDSFGWGLNSGKYNLWRAYEGFDGAYRNFLSWNNLMGDPGSIIWTYEPYPIEVEHPEEFQVNASRFSVAVTNEEGDPEADALVCIPHDKIYQR